MVVVAAALASVSIVGALVVVVAIIGVFMFSNGFHTSKSVDVNIHAPVGAERAGGSSAEVGYARSFASSARASSERTARWA